MLGYYEELKARWHDTPYKIPMDESQSIDGMAQAPGRYYCECDVDTFGQEERGEHRLLFSNDGLVYYTADHYDTFTLIYGKEVLDIR